MSNNSSSLNIENRHLSKNYQRLGVYNSDIDNSKKIKNMSNQDDVEESFDDFGNISKSTRSEIERFEALHPRIYILFDLLDSIRNPILQQQIRDQVICIEDSFINSPEWTLHRNIFNIKIGIVGDKSSNKSSLVHRYLTGNYIEEDTGDGGRFKKEIEIGDQNHLMLIRDEGGCPDLQFSNWIDGLILVYSRENSDSFLIIKQYYDIILKHRQNRKFPVVICENRDVIDRYEGDCEVCHKAIEYSKILDNCIYIETSAAYGLNVDIIFEEIAKKALMNSINAMTRSNLLKYTIPTVRNCKLLKLENINNENECSPRKLLERLDLTKSYDYGNNTMLRRDVGTINDDQFLRDYKKNKSFENNALTKSLMIERKNSPRNSVAQPKSKSFNAHVNTNSFQKYFITPTQARRHMRRSNVFNNNKKKDKHFMVLPETITEAFKIEKEGFLLKKNDNKIIRDFRKKFVTIRSDHKLYYYSSNKDASTAKFIDLSKTTVKLHSVISKSSFLSNAEEKEDLSMKNEEKKYKRIKNKKSKTGDKSDESTFEFEIVSMDNKHWVFEAADSADRDDWVREIKRQIVEAFQTNSFMSVSENCIRVNGTTMFREIDGNNKCADCGDINPGWASINHGSLICIECSGVHRNLGAHISKVRSIELDQW
ncbi:hypothetical protein A3Q56_02561, partial [Intoshia linei]